MSPLRVVPDPELAPEPAPEQTDTEHVTDVVSQIGLQMVRVSDALGALSVAMSDTNKAIEEYLRVLREYYDTERTRGKDTRR